MNRVLALYLMLIPSLIFTACKPDKPQQGNSDAATQTVSLKTCAISKPVQNSTLQILAKPQIPILCYHRIADGRNDNYSVSTTTFNSQIKTLSDSGFNSISPVQLYDYLVYNSALPEKPVMLTFDDSRAEHAAIAAPVLEKYGFRGVFFIMTITYNKKNYMSKSQITDLAKAGHTVGLHTWDHVMVTKYKDSADWKTEIVKPKAILEQITGQPVEYFAYPYGIFNHKSAVELSKYFKLSFILSEQRDSTIPLQTVRRIIAPECSAKNLLKSMHRSFSKK